jgi:hypothetical protein
MRDDMKKAATVKVKIERNRVYRDDLTQEGSPIMRIVSPTEYVVMRGEEVLARIVKGGNGWRATVPTENSKLGYAVSPTNLNKFSRVREWAIKKWGGARNQSAAI